MIRTIEERSLNALPALQTIHVDGWVLRFANGYTKRANSINPLYASTSDAREKIRFCEEIYRHKHLPVVFKMTSAALPENLDALLAEIGYELNSPTSVQIAELDHVDANASTAKVNETLTEEWFADFCRMNSITEKNKSTLWQILESIQLPNCFVTVRDGGKAVACGMSVLQREYIGLFDIVTDAPFRNKGFAKHTVRHLLAWGKQNGARRAYLQVMENNAPALQLYSKIGFDPVYQYWYRIKK